MPQHGPTFLESLREMDSDHRAQRSGGGGASERHLWWVLWLGAWAQFSHHKRLHHAWSSKTLFIHLENKYTMAMNYASTERRERRSLGVHTGSFLQVPPRPEAGEVGGWDNGEAYALALRGG